MDIFGELEVEPEAIVQGSGSKQRQQLLSGVCPQGAVISRVNCQSQIPQPHGLFLRKTPTCLQTHTHTPPLNDFLQVLLDSVSMGAVHPPTHTHTAVPPSPPLPTVCRKHSSLLWRCRSRQLMHSQIPGSFLGNEGLKRYIHTFTHKLGKQKPREGCRTPLAKYICVAFLTVKRLD